MSIKDFLSPKCVSVDVRESDKTRLLHEMARQAASALNLSADRIANELLKREELGSTGTGGGMAIPHARIPEVKKPFGMLVRLRHAIDFHAVDDRPVDIVFLLLLPAGEAGQQLNSLASVARKLRNPDCLRRLRRAANASEVFGIMVDEAKG
jgi:PTS system nitrogen regulatory IIA component